jgi:hypothetical protein
MTIKIILDRLIAHILLIIEDCHAYRLPHCLTVAYRIAYHQNNTGSSHCRAYHLTAGLSHTVSLPHTSSHCRTHRLTAAHIVSLPRISSHCRAYCLSHIVSLPRVSSLSLKTAVHIVIVSHGCILYYIIINCIALSCIVVMPIRRKSGVIPSTWCLMK